MRKNSLGRGVPSVKKAQKIQKMAFVGGTTVAEVKSWLSENIDAGAECPCCFQTVKLYPRKITSPMARGLIKQYRAVGLDFAHSAALVKSETHEFSQLSWWGLVSELDERREDGGRPGWWRITSPGEDFVLGRVSLPETAYVYNKQVRFFDSSEQIYIRQALGTKFDYDELMGRRVGDGNTLTPL